MCTLSHDSPALRTASLALMVLVSLAACSKEREPRIGQGIHPLGWADLEHIQSPAFHATWLRENGDDLARCRDCHGDDYEGGAVGVGCKDSNCHESEQGPEACGTCHGKIGDNGRRAAEDPRPGSGAHEKHERFCAECHVVPENVDDETHIDGEDGPEITFSGLALANDATPTFDAEDERCSGTYCHVAGTPEWEQDDELGCDGCHSAPPDNHERFAAIAQPPDDCKNCHADPAEDTHVNGQVDLALGDDSCNGVCHGSEESPAPPAALSHEDDDPAIGAHQRHLDANLTDRVAQPVACESCHVVPAEDDVLADGHIDEEAPADVTLVDDGQYEVADRTCTVWCHYDQVPAWTDPSNEASACNSCHDAPPASHARFARIAANDQTCGVCHPAPPADTHVNHRIDLALPEGCGTCHGSNDAGYPPVALDGSSDVADPGVGAHQTHLDPSPALYGRISAPVACASCHPIDPLAPPEDYLFDEDHIDSTEPADVTLIDGGTYNERATTCTVSCHWGQDPNVPRPVWTEVGVDANGVPNGTGQFRQCGACHAMPPAVARTGDPHPASGPNLSDCIICHDYSPETHVDGEPTFY